MNRRNLLKQLGGVASAGLVPAFWPIGNCAWAAGAPTSTNKRMIVVMLRGAVDGLSVVVPYSDERYYQARPLIAIAKPGSDGGVLPLNDLFGLHPALAPMMPLWSSGRLAFVHAAGSPDPTRSHFDAQDYMESGTPGLKNTQDGWMNRLLGVLPQPHTTTQAVSLGPVLPRILSGHEIVATIPLGRAATKQSAIDRPAVGAAFDQLYANAGALGNAYREGRQSRQEVMSDLDSGEMSSESKAADGGAPTVVGYAQDVDQLARLMRSEASVQLAFMQLGGWDTHVNQGNADGQLAKRLQPLGEGLAQLAQKLGPLFDDTVIVVVSEFGRTMHENGNRGTDHGHGNVIWVLGGPVVGGKVYGEWPGLDDAALHEGRDLAVTTDFRSVLRSIGERHLRLSDSQLARVFPAAPKMTRDSIGLIRT